MSRDEAAIGVSGRINPGPARHPLDGDHDVRFYAECKPCGWRSEFEIGRYDAEAQKRLKAMHEGDTP